VLAGAKAPRALATNVRLGAPFSSTFTTSSIPSSTAAPFETAPPIPGRRDRRVNRCVPERTFTVSIDPRSVSAKTVKLFGPQGTRSSWPKVPVIAEDGKSFSWQPLAPLAASTSYRLTLKGGKKGVRGANRPADAEQCRGVVHDLPGCGHLADGTRNLRLSHRTPFGMRASPDAGGALLALCTLPVPARLAARPGQSVSRDGLAG